MNLVFFIAKRYLVSKKSNNAINIISWISVVSIAIGTAALIIILSGMNGLTNLVEGLYNSFDADIEITAAKGKVFIPDSAKTVALHKVTGIKQVCFTLQDNALLKYDNKQTIATVKGVGENYLSMTRFDTLLVEGNFITRKENALYGVFGKGLAFRLGCSVKNIFSPVTLYAPKRGFVNSVNPEESVEELKVYPSGIFSINDDFDFRYMISDLGAARQLFGYSNEVSAIELGCDASVNTESIQQEVQLIMGNDYVVKNRYQQNEMLFKTLKTEKLLTFIILSIVLVVATFNIIGALTMLIIEKKKDIVILHNMGADISLIQKIFLTEGLLITVMGSVIGLGIGLLLCWLQQQFGLIKFDADYVVEAYPIDIRWSDFLSILTVVTLIGFFAAWYPVRIFARNNAKLEELMA